MKIISEFKEFITKGNAFDLAVGVIIGGAFTPVVNSMVEDIIMPVVSMGVGSTNFENLYLPLSKGGAEALAKAIETGGPLPTLAQAKEFGAILTYGVFLNTLVSFFFLMLGVFVLIKMVNAFRKPAPSPAAPEPAPVPADIALLTEIRDLLKK
ncbi:MAG: large conductance mechanosensitive channel protein MscL [Blastochloris sp.]|nr:large conductance mechanosensitive channel protein MscL [Blastochloris sp.]